MGEGNISLGAVTFPCVTGPALSGAGAWPWCEASGGPGAQSQRATWRQGRGDEPRWRGGPAQVRRHLSAVLQKDEPQVMFFFFPHVLLGAKGPQKGRKGKMDSCQPYINAILNSKSWWKNLAEEQITPASKLAIRLFCLSTN